MSLKNDITYEYRVFTNRLIDVEAMEAGKCTSKVIKELKAKDKVDGRFFHTSDTDEWFFCWNGDLQKLNLKGDVDVNDALAQVEKLISEANTAVDAAKATAKEAKEAADAAKVAADSATEAVESIENKADKTVVDELTQTVESKADKTVVDELVGSVAKKADVESVETLSQAVEEKANKSELATKADASTVQEISDKVDAIKLDDYALKADVPSIEGLATETFVNEEIAKIVIPKVPTKVSELENDKNYLTKSEADATYAKIGSGTGSEGVDLSDYATKEYVGEEIAKIEIPNIDGKQDVISDLDAIRSGAALGVTALQEVPAEYITETELTEKGYLTSQSLNGYATEEYVDGKIPTKVSELENDANYLTAHQDISGKQDVIEDLETIRSGAALGATSIQSLDGYATEEYVTSQGYALKSEIPSLDDYYTKGEIDSKIDAINALIGQATEITNTILA